MAIKLPSPEEYGKKLAADRRKASGVPEVLANLARATQDIEKALQAALAKMAEQNAKAQEDAAQTQRQALGEAIEAVPLPFVLEKLETLMGAVESLYGQIDRHGETIMQAMMPAERPPVDLSAVEAKLAAIEQRVEQRNEVQVVEAPVPTQPTELRLHSFERDGAGDIAEVTVQVTKH